MPGNLIDLAYNDTQRLDLFLHGQPGRALVVCVHGGGFISGSKDDERCRQSAALLLEAGFNVASISYSLAPPGDRFAMWPRNLFDLADALAFLERSSGEFGLDFSRLGLLGFSAGCCLANLYIQGGERLFRHFDYDTPVFRPAAIAGFYGPYDFSRRQPERRSEDPEINRFHSPAYWLKLDQRTDPPPVLHIQGDRDTIVYPSQHEAFRADCEARGYPFTEVIAQGFDHAFAPRDVNLDGEAADFGPRLVEFFTEHLRT